MTTHGDKGKIVRYSRVSRLCDHQTDDHISEKLLVTDYLSFVPVCCHVVIDLHTKIEPFYVLIKSKEQNLKCKVKGKRKGEWKVKLWQKWKNASPPARRFSFLRSVFLFPFDLALYVCWVTEQRRTRKKNSFPPHSNLLGILLIWGRNYTKLR